MSQTFSLLGAQPIFFGSESGLCFVLDFSVLVLRCLAAFIFLVYEFLIVVIRVEVFYF